MLISTFVAKKLACASLSALLVLLIACGSSKGSKQTFDPKKADAEAHAALLKEGELPGSGWKATGDDKFTDDELAGVSGCGDMQAFENDAHKSEISRARRDFDRASSGALVPSSVSVDVHIYDNDGQVSTLLKRFKSLVDGGKVKPCLTAFFQDKIKAANITVKDTTPSNAAPSGGIALAFDLSVGPLNLRAENYQWTVGNGVLETTFTGPKEAITSDLINSTNQKLASAADQVAKGSRSQ
jgi:hypothetical protein